MPIYAYRCEACGHAKDVLQKVSDPLLSTCPACGTGAFKKQLTAAGFQLKGSGWYATDFRNGSQAKPAEGGEATKPDAAPAADAPAKTATPAAAGDKGSGGNGSGSKATGTGAAPAASPPASSAGGCGSSCACH